MVFLIFKICSVVHYNISFKKSDLRIMDREIKLEKTFSCIIQIVL